MLARQCLIHLLRVSARHARSVERGPVFNLLLSSLIKRITPKTSRTLSSTGAVGLLSRFDSVRAASSASLIPMISEWPGNHLNL
jgi:hypothetical protein